MKKVKFVKNTGITLVALVITIVLLLILAGISIATLTSSGLFEKARLAEQESKAGQEKEEAILGEYENQINSHINGTRNNTKEYGYFFNESMSNVANNTDIAFGKIEGNMECNENNYTITLKANKHYYMNFSVRTYDVSGDYGDFIVYNETDSEAIKTINWASGGWIYNTTSLIYTPEKDIIMSVRATTTSNIEYVTSLSLTIYEI